MRSPRTRGGRIGCLEHTVTLNLRWAESRTRFRPEDAVGAGQVLAAGELAEDELADWFHTRLRVA